jgi:hypothetical protein
MGQSSEAQHLRRVLVSSGQQCPVSRSANFSVSARHLSVTLLPSIVDLILQTVLWTRWNPFKLHKHYSGSLPSRSLYMKRPPEVMQLTGCAPGAPDAAQRLLSTNLVMAGPASSGLPTVQQLLAS